MFDLKFTYNWNNKLHCRAFTTIRLFNPYQHIPGNRCNLFLKDETIGAGTIGAVNRFKLNSLTETMAWIDTGYSAAQARNILMKMYKNIDWSTKELAFILIIKDEEEKK